MPTLAKRIETDEVEKESLVIYWLSQAGFVFKTSSEEVVYIDPYFSDVVERVFGFKRMMACPISPEEVVADLVICTHEHLDHMDTDGLPILAKHARTHFVGPIECFREFKKMGVPEVRCHLLEEGAEIDHRDIKVRAVYADHGELAPDAVGVVLDLEGIKVYHTGDTAYRPAEFKQAIELQPDILLPCINGRYGNMDAREAALLTQAVKPRVVIASHFWMFVEHNGDPAAFLDYCSKLAPEARAIVMKPGERFVFRKA